INNITNAWQYIKGPIWSWNVCSKVLVLMGVKCLECLALHLSAIYLDYCYTIPVVLLLYLCYLCYGHLAICAILDTCAILRKLVLFPSCAILLSFT
ncbi:hypothetical protein Taro_021258, partial [Colocasia esculenta]|nr:hypothetical protein [Colocasia esculenta]